MLQSHLKCNRVLDEIVKVFVTLRPKLLKILKEYKAIKEREASKSPFLKRGLSKSPQNKRKEDSPRKKFLSPRKKRSTKKVVYSNETSDSETVFSLRETSDSDFEPSSFRKRKRQGSFAGSRTLTLTESGSEARSDHDPDDVRFASCPVCNESVDKKKINSHLDRCLVKASGKTRESLRPKSKSCSMLQHATKRCKVAEASDTDLSDAKIDSDNGCPPSNIFAAIDAYEMSESLLTNNSHAVTAPEEVLPSACQASTVAEDDGTSDHQKQAAESDRSTAPFKLQASNELLPEIPAERRKKLPPLVFNGMTEAQLRKKLRGYGLSFKGNKKTLETRLKKYFLLHNSECDAIDPMPVKQIIKNIETQEANQKKLDQGAVLVKTFDCSKTAQEKEDFNKNYLIKHDNQFKQLIREVASRTLRGKSHNKAIEKDAISSQSSSIATLKQITAPDGSGGIQETSEDEANVTKKQGFIETGIHNQPTVESPLNPVEQFTFSGAGKMPETSQGEGNRKTDRSLINTEDEKDSEKNIDKQSGIKMLHRAVKEALAFVKDDILKTPNRDMTSDRPSSKPARALAPHNATESRSCNIAHVGNSSSARRKLALGESSQEKGIDDECQETDVVSRNLGAVENADKEENKKVSTVAAENPVEASCSFFSPNKRVRMLPENASTPLKASRPDASYENPLVIHDSGSDSDWSDSELTVSPFVRTKNTSHLTSANQKITSETSNADRPKLKNKSSDLKPTAGSSLKSSQRKLTSSKKGKSKDMPRIKCRNIQSFFVKRQVDDSTNNASGFDLKNKEEQQTPDGSYNSSALLFDDTSSDGL
ncbi:uncharacterized protein LOC135692614 isoform X2 [Rhopilema esculentum]